MNPHTITTEFENAVADYCGSRFAVAVNSCTNALFLSLMWHKHKGLLPDYIECPARTYISVPMQIVHAGAQILFRDYCWRGMYQLAPLPIFDAARRFTSGMAIPNSFVCTSHHWTKILGCGQAGMILHSDEEADAWLRKARFDGRTPGATPDQDSLDTLGWHMYLSPDVSAEGLMRLSVLPLSNADLPNSNYPDLSLASCFQAHQIGVKKVA